MRNKIGDIERLGHILDSIDFINKAVDNKNELQFQEDFILHTAVIKWIEIIGEACIKISPILKIQHTQIEWKKIEGLRHVLVHEYFGIDLERVWIVVLDYLPTLKKEITILLKETKQ
jgi:uncharacterized protein with HEPN domain